MTKNKLFPTSRIFPGFGAPPLDAPVEPPTPPPDPDPVFDPEDDLIKFWQEPVSGDLSALGIGDATGVREDGTPALAEIGAYHAGTVNAVTYGSGNRLEYPNAFELTMTQSFWIAGIFKVTNSPSNEGIASTRGGAGAGWRIKLNSNNIAVDVYDGTVTKSTNLTGFPTFALGAWHSFIVEFLMDPDNNKCTVRATVDGVGQYTSAAAERELTALNNLSDDLAYNQDLVVGDLRTFTNAPFDGELLLYGGLLPGGASPTFLSATQMTYLHSYKHGRLYNGDADSAVTRVKYILAQPSEGGFDLSVRGIDRTEVCTVKALNATTRAELDSQTLPIPTNGFSKVSLTGLGDNQAVQIEFHYDDGSVDPREGHYTTIPADNNYTVAVCGCSYWAEFSRAGNDLTGDEFIVWQVWNDSDSPRFAFWAEDWGYFDFQREELGGPVTTMAGALTRFDTITDLHHCHWFGDHMPIIMGAGDHAFEDDGDSTSSFIALGRQFFRTMCPNPDTNWGDGITDNSASAGWYYSVVLNDIRYIVMDCSSDKIIAGSEPDAKMIGDTQKTWWKAELTSANTAGQVVVNQWIHVLDSDPPSTPVAQQFWEFYPTQRTELFDHIETTFGTTENHFISVCGDLHSRGIDTGANQGDFDTGGDLSLPTILAAVFLQDPIGIKGTWDTVSDGDRKSWGKLRFNNDEGVPGQVDCELIGVVGATEDVATLSVTLTK